MLALRATRILKTARRESPLLPKFQKMANHTESYDPEQMRLMEERVLVVDRDDKVIRSGSKEETHLMENISKGLLHRAFSVFLFNTKGELLLQQRAAEKITFPSHWTNTCCSHPLDFENEKIEANELGVRNAAIRKLEHELGIPLTTFQPSDFTFLTKIHYLSPSDGKWGEHEIDYILIAQKDVHFTANPNEVQATRFVNPEQLKELFKTSGILMTPWFQIIADKFLYTWWNHLGDLESQKDVNTIHRVGVE